LFEQQYLGVSIAAGDLASEPGRYDAAIVEYKCISRPDKIRYIEKIPVLRITCFAVDYHQAGMVTGFDGMLGDQPGRQVIVKVGQLHK
jgi:hypothetical protein